MGDGTGMSGMALLAGAAGLLALPLAERPAAAAVAGSLLGAGVCGLWLGAAGRRRNVRVHRRSVLEAMVQRRGDRAAQRDLARSSRCMESAHAVAWEWTRQDGFWIGDGAERWLGSGLDDAAFEELVAARLLDEDRAWLEELFAALSPDDGAGPFQVDVRVEAGGSTPTWLSTRFGVEWGDDGRPAAFRGTAQDVTARKGVESEFVTAWLHAMSVARTEAAHAEQVLSAEPAPGP